MNEAGTHELYSRMQTKGRRKDGMKNGRMYLGRKEGRNGGRKEGKKDG